VLHSYRIAPENRLRLSPLWGEEAAVFIPATTEIAVVTELAARLLGAVQRHGLPVSVARLAEELEATRESIAQSVPREQVEAMLIELERLGFLESSAP
jgi:hypothetical protein